MFNPYILKKYAALLFNGFAAVIMFYIGTIFFGFWGGLLFMFFGLILGLIVANIMLKNPFTSMLEGKGILTLPIDSSGLITPFIMNVNLPFVQGKYRNQEISDVFNRSTVFNLQTPQDITPDTEITQDEEGNQTMNIKITEDEFNTGRFQLNQYPCFIYSLPLNSVITKDMLAARENKYFAEHTIINLNRKVNELGRWIRDFARHAIEQMRPKQPMDIKKVAIWALLLIIGVMVIIFLPKLVAILQSGGGSSVGSAVSGAINSATAITPR